MCCGLLVPRTIFNMKWLYIITSLLMLISQAPVKAVITLDILNLQPSIVEFTTVQTKVQGFTIDGADNPNNVICYVQHVLPQPNTDSLIGPFEINALQTEVVYDPDNGFPLNTLLQSFYQIRVCCYEANQAVTPDPPTCSPMFITISKNSPPTISGPSQTSISGDADVGDVVASFPIIRDADVGDTITRSLTAQPADASKFFTIDQSGTITLAKEAETIPYGQVTILINATDGKDATIFPLQLTINDFNSRPNIRELPRNVTIREDATKDTLITRLTFQDPDGFRVAIDPVCTVNPKEESSKFVYDTIRNEIKLTNLSERPLDFESLSFYNITCVISDGFLDSEGETLGVYVENVNEAPVFQKASQTCQLYESPAAESFCDVRFQVTDPDNDAVTISLAGNFSNIFALTDNNRRLTFAVDYDLEAISSPTSVILHVVATDPFGATGTTIVTVAIADVNDNDPIFTTEITTIPIGYGTGIGLIGTLTATDRDLGTNGDLIFSTVSISPPDAATHFNLFNNGEIHYLSQYPDVLAGTTALITAKATDKGVPRRSATSTIAISFGTTTTSTTTTTTTTTPTTTTTTTTTTPAPTPAPFDFWARPENVAMFSILMALLILAVLAALWFCLRFCLMGSFGGGPPTLGIFRDCFGRCCGPGSCSGFAERCRSLDCDCDCDCCRPKRIQPQIVRSIDYNEDFWRKSDHYESGKPFY